MRENGIFVNGKIRVIAWPEIPDWNETNLVKLGEVKSPPLREIIRGFLKPSQNLETDLVFDHVGEIFRGSNSPAGETSEALAVAALENFLKTNGVPADAHFDEGSGLSRNNLTSANATVALLTLMAKSRWAQDYFDALPIAGVDGTLRHRMKNTPAFQNVRAKTGTLRWANSLSGYVTTAAGEKLAFSLMLNRYAAPPDRNRTAELDDIAVLLAGFKGKFRRIKNEKNFANCLQKSLAFSFDLIKIGRLKIMNPFLPLGKFSFGLGDRFGHQGKAQLRACMLAHELGAEFIPVWNKSHREHTFIGTEPSSLRAAADAAVKALDWKKNYHVDADHIRLETVDRFIAPSDFFTIDVADSIGKSASAADVKNFVDRHVELAGKILIPQIESPFEISRAEVERVANKFLLAIQDAGKIYRHIAKNKGAENFITEVSMDETDSPQTPPELLIILAALADEKIPLQTIAPKFTGRFNKGVDYVGDVKQFEKEFNEDLAVIAFAVKKYGLPASLKLSVHSGSDKFSIYEPMRRALKKFDAGVHIKTAGTTWLEELIGLAEAGGDGLKIAKEIYTYAMEHVDEFCAPYASVIDIDKKKLPPAAEVNKWSSKQFTDALRHDQKNPNYNPSFRQLLHVSFKVAAKKGGRYLNALDKHEAIIAKNVTENLFERHMKPLLLAGQ